MKILGVVVLVWALLSVSGCSSESTQVTGVPGGFPAPAATGVVTGKFFLGATVANATVTIQGLNGEALRTLTTDATGNFLARGTFPAEFRVRGQVGASGFVTEVRGFRGQAFVALNVPNTLASEYLAGRPGTSLEQAQSWARTQLALPPKTGLGWIEDGPRAAFSHLEFFHQAARNGGWAAYSAQVVGSSQPTGPYRLDFRTLRASLGGLEPELLVLVTAAQRQPRLVATVRAQRQDLALAGRLQARLTGSGEEIRASLLTDFGGFLLSGVGGSIVTDVTNNLLGWVTTSLGWNIGTAGALNQIQNELNALMTDLNLLAVAGATNNAATELSGYVTSTNTLITQQNSAVNVATNANTTNPTNLPTSTSNSDLTTLLGTLASYAASTNLQQFANYMLGTNGVSNLLLLNLKTTLNQSYGIQQDGGTFPVRSSLLLDQCLNTFNYYAGQQSLTANYLVEQAHPAMPLAAPAIALQDAGVTVAGSAYSLLLQRQQFPPYPVSDNILVDLQNGLVWYTEVQSAQSWADADAAANSFVVEVSGVTYQNWRLPTFTELETLQNRGRYVATSLRDSSVAQNGSDSSYGNYGYVLQGLSGGASGTLGLGFSNVNLINSDGVVWFYDWVYDNSQWKNLSTESVFRLNHEDDTTDSSKDPQPYLMVRSLGPTLLSPGYAQNNPDLPGPIQAQAPSPMNFYNLDSGEFFGEADPTGIASVTRTSANVSINLSAQTGGANTSTVNSVQDFAVANVTYTLAMGGKFAYGSSGQTTQTNPTQSFTETLPVGGYQGYFSDVQSPLAFNVTAGAANATVSNYNGLQGLISWHASSASPISAVVQAIVLGPAGQVTGSSSLTQPSPRVAGLTSILISPRNLLLTNGNLTSNSGVQDRCTGYYSDQTVADLTNRVTWTVANNSTGNTSSSVFFSGTQLALNNQPLPQTMSQALFNVTATLTNATLASGQPGTVRDSTYVQLGQPPNQ